MLCVREQFCKSAFVVSVVFGVKLYYISYCINTGQLYFLISTIIYIIYIYIYILEMYQCKNYLNYEHQHQLVEFSWAVKFALP